MKYLHSLSDKSITSLIYNISNQQSNQRQIKQKEKRQNSQIKRGSFGYQNRQVLQKLQWCINAALNNTVATWLLLWKAVSIVTLESDKKKHDLGANKEEWATKPKFIEIL